MNDVLDAYSAPPPEISLQLDDEINEHLKEYSLQAQTLWLLMAATNRYYEIDDPDFDLMDFQLAAERVIRDTHD